MPETQAKLPTDTPAATPAAPATARKKAPAAQSFSTLTEAMTALGEGDGRHIYKATLEDGDELVADTVRFVVAASPAQALCKVAEDDGWKISTVGQKEQLVASRLALAKK